jgi:hypothetical protein
MQDMPDLYDLTPELAVTKRTPSMPPFPSKITRTLAIADTRAAPRRRRPKP